MEILDLNDGNAIYSLEGNYRVNMAKYSALALYFIPIAYFISKYEYSAVYELHLNTVRSHDVI